MNSKHFSRSIRVCFFVSFFVCSFISQAQELQWARAIGGYNSELGKCISVDRFGNTYTIGNFTGTVDFDPSDDVYNLTSLGNEDFFILKMNSSGDFVWAKSIGDVNSDYGTRITVDVNGNVFCVGSFRGVVDFDPGFGVFNLSSTGLYLNDDVFVLKLNSSGDFIWAKKLGGQFNDYGTSLCVDDSGKLSFVGRFRDTIEFGQNLSSFNLISNGDYDFFIVQMDNNGSYLWTKSIGGIDYDNVTSVHADGSGNVSLTGSFKSTVDFDPGIGIYNLSSPSNSNVFILKLGVTGEFIGAWHLNGAGYKEGNSIVLDEMSNMYITGEFWGTVDFDPGPANYNLTSAGASDIFVLKIDSVGNFVWAKRFGEANNDFGNSIAIDDFGVVYTIGNYSNTVDFDPGISVSSVSSNGFEDIFVLGLDFAGNFSSIKSRGSTIFDEGMSVAVDNRGNIYTTGYFQGIVNFGMFPNAISLDATANAWDVFIAKDKSRGVYGYVYNDISEDCQFDNNELGINGIRGVIYPEEVVVETDNNGLWDIDYLPVGGYTLVIDSSSKWLSVCNNTITFTVTNSASVLAAGTLGMTSTQPCSQPDISITAPLLRRCFSNQSIYVQACNAYTATGALNSAYVDVELDSLLTPTSSSLPYINLGNNQYRFNVGNINPGQCVNFTINTTVSCATNLQQTLCMEARLFPADSCVFDTIATPTLPVGPGTVTPCNLPWDHSSLSVDGYCANDTVYFTITNNGSASNGNMLCYAPVRVYVDGVLSYTDSIMLSGGQTITYSYPGNGQTWILQADQHPLHPGNSHPNAHVEACGNMANWTPNLINNLPLDDADPIKDVYCGIVSGAYDPNDKTGFPTGLGTQHEVLPNQQLQYLIRFQNTGTDTAFTVVVRDTLDTDLNIFSVVPGVASHNYSFRMYGPRVLEWTFNNIMLPDSNVNEAASHGFLTFTVEQQSNLPNGTSILNDADIYFDYNVPVITNQTVHTINNQIHNYAVGIASNTAFQKPLLKVYPNPTKGNVYVELKGVSPKVEISILNVLGQQISKQQFYNVKSCNLTIEGEPGVYFVKVSSGNKTEYIKLLKL